MLRPAVLPPLPRPVCYRCDKPLVTCICAGLVRVDNRVPVLVLQHPRERLHPIGTARFARLGLANARVEVAWDASRLEDEPPSWLSEGSALLYPTAAARDLRELSPAERPRQLVVLDGTWNTARTLYRDKRWLHRLPHYRCLPTAPDRYRLRREPQDDYLSTIEAIVDALRILEPDTTGLDALLGAFDAMIDRQIEYIERGVGRTRSLERRRPRSQLRMPHALVDGFERVIVTYGEPSRPLLERDREFVYFGAVALGSGARFERLIRPASGVPDAEHLSHMGLSPEDFASAVGRDEFLRDFAEFAKGETHLPLMAAWNERTLELIARQTGQPPARLTIKSAYRSIFGRSSRDLDDVIARHALPLADTFMRGRASGRLAGAVAVSRFLHARANE
jgi:DTW domain-containing protein